MKIKLLNYIPLSIAVIAGRTAWQSFHKGGNYRFPTDDITKEDYQFLDRLFNKYKHISVAEHIWYTFDIKDIKPKLLAKIKNEYNFYSIDKNITFSVNLRTIFEELNSDYSGNSKIKNFYLELIKHLPENHKNLILKKEKGNGKDFIFEKTIKENEHGHKVELLFFYKFVTNAEFERRPHSFYSFRISGISRALLQELVRHDDLLAITVKSTRYTLKELKNEDIFEKNEEGLKKAKKYLVFQPAISRGQIEELNILKRYIDKGLANDITKYLLPESYRTECIITLNENNLKNLLKLRLDKAALWEFQSLAKLIKESSNGFLQQY